MRVRQIPSGRPPFATSQREKILGLLRQAGSHGVRREDLIFQHRWTQAGTRIFELEQMGYKIRHESRPGERLIVYVLESEPLELKPLQDSPSERATRDWYEKQTGRPRTSRETPVLPLFAAVQR